MRCRFGRTAALRLFGLKPNERTRRIFDACESDGRPDSGNFGREGRSGMMGVSGKGGRAGNCEERIDTSDYKGQKRDEKGRFARENKHKSSVAKQKKRGIIKGGRNIPRDSNGVSYKYPSCPNLTMREISRITHAVNTNFEKFKSVEMGVITLPDGVGGRYHTYTFEIHGFNEFNIFKKKLNRK